MWRFQSTHERSETEYLDQTIERLEADTFLSKRADALLDGASASEPMLADLFRTPQDIRYHAEGPVVRDHLKQMLIALYGLVEEKFHLIDLEEFRRLKGYEGEIEELEETIKEHIGLFEVFTLCHDIGKWSSISFHSPIGSKGEQEGFNVSRTQLFREASSERLQMMKAYQERYKIFSASRPNECPREIQADFFMTYKIEVHYPNHAKKIYAPTSEALLERFCIAHQLPVREHDLLIDLIAHHMDVIRDFQTVRPERFGSYVHLAMSHGVDADDYTDLMQGALALDTMLGSKRLSAHGYWQDALPLIHCLRSEHDFAPHRRGEKEDERAAEHRREHNRGFREVGLDGEAMMDLLEMDPGPEFGRLLRRIHAAVLGQGDMPQLKTSVRKEVEERAGAFYNRMFVKGD